MAGTLATAHALQLVVETLLFRPTWGAYTVRKVKTAWPMISWRRNYPARYALDLNNFVSPVLCQHYAGFWTEEKLELAVLAHKSTDLVGFKGTREPVFLYTTDVNLSPRRCLHHFGISFIEGSQIASGNSDIGLGLLHLLGLGMSWHAC